MYAHRADGEGEKNAEQEKYIIILYIVCGEALQNDGGE